MQIAARGARREAAWQGDGTKAAEGRTKALSLVQLGMAAQTTGPERRPRRHPEAPKPIVGEGTGARQALKLCRAQNAPGQAFT